MVIFQDILDECKRIDIKENGGLVLRDNDEKILKRAIIEAFSIVMDKIKKIEKILEKEGNIF